MKLDILTDPNPLLRQANRDLNAADLATEEMRNFIASLTETMYASDGVGIAAPQVGKSVNLCVIAKNFSNSKDKDLVLVNPEWEKRAIAKIWGEEGCLSVPGLYGKVRRYKKIRVNALDEYGQTVEFEADDFFARVLQHEIDHLNGILFIDKAKDIYHIDKNL